MRSLGTKTNRWVHGARKWCSSVQNVVQVVGDDCCVWSSFVCMWSFLMPIGRYAELKLGSRYATCTDFCAGPLSMVRPTFFQVFMNACF